MPVPVIFDPLRWQRLLRDYDAWWRGELDRPLVSLTLPGRRPDRPMPDAPLPGQHNCHDFSIDPALLADRIAYELESLRWIADSFPHVSLDTFGPGIAAVFMGGELDNSSGRVWFYPAGRQYRDLEDIKPVFQRENPYLLRICDLYRAMQNRWGNQVQISMPDLGGILDILASLRGSENLMYDFFDAPDEIVRVTGAIEQGWLNAYDIFNEALQPLNPGYSDWSAILSPVPSYVLQCDAAYMIGPDLFNRFVLPELDRTSSRLGHAMYHLDGKGQLIHLDAILSLPGLDAVQWVPGDGAPLHSSWQEVYERIFAAGKQAQCITTLDEAERLVDKIGYSRGFMFRLYFPNGKIPADLEQRLARLGVPEDLLAG